jgi:hypothetical protein
MDVGAIERRSGRVPDPGAGGADGRGAGTDAGGGALGRRPTGPADDPRAGTSPAGRGTDSAAKDGGGTKALRAMDDF